MRYGIVVATAALALPATAAHAEDWCGYTAKDNAVIECGYTTASGCADAVGKGGMCFVDPDVALNTKARRLSAPMLSRPITVPASFRSSSRQAAAPERHRSN